MSWLSAVRRGWHSLCDVLEIKLAIVTKDKSSQCYQQLGEWWVHIDKVLRFDVFRGKFSEMDLVKAAPVRVRYLSHEQGLTQRCWAWTVGTSAHPLQPGRSKATTSTPQTSHLILPVDNSSFGPDQSLSTQQLYGRPHRGGLP